MTTSKHELFVGSARYTWPRASRGIRVGRVQRVEQRVDESILLHQRFDVVADRRPALVPTARISPDYGSLRHVAQGHDNVSQGLQVHIRLLADFVR